MHYAHLALTFGEVALGRRVKKAVKTMIMVHIVLETLANLISDAIAAVDQVVQSQGTTLSHAALGIGNRLRQKLVGEEELTLRPDPKPFLLYGMLRECSARCAEIADDIWALLQSRQAMGKRGPILRLFLAKDWKSMRANAFESVEFSFHKCKGKKLDTRRPFDAIRNGAVEGDRLEVCANFWLREREYIMAVSGARRQHMVLDTRHVPPQYDIADLKRLNTKEKHLLRARYMATFLAVEYNILRQSEECGASLRWEAARTQVRVEANYQGAEAVREHSKNTRELKEGIREISNALRWCMYHPSSLLLFQADSKPFSKSPHLKHVWRQRHKSLYTESFPFGCACRCPVGELEKPPVVEDLYSRNRVLCNEGGNKPWSRKVVAHGCKYGGLGAGSREEGREAESGGG